MADTGVTDGALLSVQDLKVHFPIKGGVLGTTFAQVRAVNQALPPDQRIHVWLGEPPIDWSAIRTRDAWQRVYDQRDAHAAEVIERDVLSRGRKALVRKRARMLRGRVAVP